MIDRDWFFNFDANVDPNRAIFVLPILMLECEQMWIVSKFRIKIGLDQRQLNIFQRKTVRQYFSRKEIAKKVTWMSEILI